MGPLLITIGSSYRLTFTKIKKTTKKQDVKEPYAYSSSLKGGRASLDSKFSLWPPVVASLTPGCQALGSALSEELLRSSLIKIQRYPSSDISELTSKVKIA